MEVRNTDIKLLHEKDGPMIEKNITNGINHLTIEGTASSNNILIFLPGIGAFKENFIEHLSAFRDFYKRIYAVDLPEQGSKGEWRVGQMVDVLAEFIYSIVEKDYEVMDLAGHSAGGIAVLSYIFNYTAKLENELLDEVRFKIKDPNARINSLLAQDSFAGEKVFRSKVRNVILYSPPDSFRTVIPEKVARSMERKSKKWVRNVMNLLINYPSLFFKQLHNNPYFDFKLNKDGKAQHFALVVDNHKDFYKYVAEFETIFELYSRMVPSNQQKVRKAISGMNVIIQYGTIDWLLKPFGKRKKKIDEVFTSFCDVTLIHYPYMGHLLNKKYRLDLNLNRQMLTNKELIENSLTFIRNNGN